MTRIRTLLGCTILAVCLAAPGSFAFAQQSGGGLLGDLFNGGSQQQAQGAPQPPGAVGQGGGASGVDARIDRLENALRQLTGEVEVLQHQNQTLQMQLKRMQDDTDYRFQQMGPGGRSAPGRPSAPGQRSQAFPPMQNSTASVPPPAQPNQTAANGGHGDAFNPAMHPDAPGVPHALGGGTPMPETNQGMNNAPIGAPGGREAGQPLDLNALAGPPPGGAAPRDNAAAEGGGTPVVSGNMGGGPMASRSMPGGAMSNGKLPPPPPR
ncbi:MAG TPA: hypothetical protein VE224_15590, partial [Pseudolabrys sp.]|nr:hypothetical protein [Pseudolabrys sp.]